MVRFSISALSPYYFVVHGYTYNKFWEKGKRFTITKITDKSNKLIEKSNKPIEKSNKLIEKSNKLIEKSNKLIEKSNKLME